MAEPKTEKVEKAKTVEIFIPKLSRDDMYQPVIINGKMSYVKKGEFVEVPISIGEAIKNSLEMQKEAEGFAMREMQKASRKAE